MTLATGTALEVDVLEAAARVAVVERDVVAVREVARRDFFTVVVVAEEPGTEANPNNPQKTMAKTRK